MNIQFFFKGKLSREEASSAFLATLLEQTEDEGEFIKDFFKLFRDLPKFIKEPIPNNIIEDLPFENYRIKTEEDEIDITMMGDKHLILIENKVKVASKTPDQMNKYYKQQKNKHRSKNIIFIYLAPTKDTAKSEIDKLDLDPNDYAIPMEWEQVFDLIKNNKKLKKNKFCNSGEKEIRELLKTGRKYENTPNRIKLKNIRAKVVVELTKKFGERDDLMEKYPGIGFMDWEGDDFIQLGTTNSNLTHYNKLIFDQKGDFDPIIDIIDQPGDKIKLNIRAEFQLSKTYGVKNEHMKKKWDKICNSKTHLISDTTYTCDDKGYYTFVKEFVGTEEELKQTMLKHSVKILDYFKEYLPATKTNPL